MTMKTLRAPGNQKSISILTCALTVIVSAMIRADEPTGKNGEVLYNGIRLSDPWPPRLDTLPRDPVTPPYLASPPAVVPIDGGRQLLVDDFLIEQTTLKRTFHQSEYYAQNPVLRPDKPWETKTTENPTAMVFSDGVWFDPNDKLFKAWYMSGHVISTCYATSTDGIHWQKPELDVVPGTNIVETSSRDSGTVWLDHNDKDPDRRFKMSLYRGGSMSLFTSRDGIHWSNPTQSGPVGDRSTIFFNPFRKVWVYSIRADTPGDGRVRRYWEHTDFLAGANWKTANEPTLWMNSDNLDPRRTDLNTQCQLYSLDCVAYESLMLGLFTVWRGQPRDRAKPNEVCLGFSRDGFHWFRPDRSPFIAVSEHQGDWNWGNVQSAGGCCLIVGDRLYFYCSGRAGHPGSPASGVSSTGLAFLRRDGFASLDAGAAEGTLTTRPIQFRGRHLFVNVAAEAGELRAEVLDEKGQVVQPFTRE